MRHAAARLACGMGLLLQMAVMAEDKTEEKIDLSTPAGASKAFARAEFMGDLPMLKEAGYFPAGWEKVAEGWAARGKAKQKLVAALAEKWGPASKDGFPGLEGTPPQFDDELKITGDTAVLVARNLKGAPPTEEYIRIDGKWKVDCVGKPEDPEKEKVRSTRFMSRKAAAIEKIAEQVSKGEFKTVEDALAGYRKALGYDD